LKTEFKIDALGTDLLQSIVGKRLDAFGTPKPGVDTGTAIEEVFIQVEGAAIVLSLDFESANVCGEIGDYLRILVDEGNQKRSESESVGGVYFFFKGETVQSVLIHTARITRNFEGVESSFEHDASVEIAFETGSLWISKTDLAVPILNFEAVIAGQPSPLTDPAEGWPNTVFDRWIGEWLS